MITDWLIDVGRQLMAWLLGLFPADWQVPDWLTGLSTQLGVVLAGAAGMGVWIPWALIFTVVTATFVLWTLGLTLKLARWLLGLVPTMGGG